MQRDTSPCGALSLLTPIGGDCGYCKDEGSSRTPNSRASYYARTKSLCPRHYQELMDRGWRRSGSLLYLPDISRSCCPHYTIRLPAKEFQPTRDQRQALHRWNRFVLGEKYFSEVNKKYPKSKEEKKKQNNTFDLHTSLHESETPNLKPDVPPEHNFTVTLEPDTFTEEKFLLFQNYQIHVHHESPSEVTRSGFKRFLCSSPLHKHTFNNQQTGSYHHCYRLDGRLIAMSVLDLLPHAVSGVYFVYHSDYEKWSFGKLSALREAALAIEGGYNWYYMGYFIWSCKKMRYKGDYRPQHVLDYDSLEWDVMDEEMKALMDRRRWVSMSRERRIKEAVEKDQGEEEALVEEIYSTELPTPVAAMESQLSLLELGVPGVMSLEDLLNEVNVEDMRVTLDSSSVHKMSDIVGWSSGSMLESRSIMGVMAELAAGIGSGLARDITVSLGG